MIDILDEAKTIINGKREDNYGKARTNHERIAKIWSVVLGIEVTPEQAALCMIGVKIARQVNKPKRDNLVDICGYAALLEKMEEESHIGICDNCGGKGYYWEPMIGEITCGKCNDQD